MLRLHMSWDQIFFHIDSCKGKDTLMQKIMTDKIYSSRIVSITKTKWKNLISASVCLTMSILLNAVNYFNNGKLG